MTSQFARARINAKVYSLDVSCVKACAHDSQLSFPCIESHTISSFSSIESSLFFPGLYLRAKDVYITFILQLLGYYFSSVKL